MSTKFRISNTSPTAGILTFRCMSDGTEGWYFDDKPVTRADAIRRIGLRQVKKIEATTRASWKQTQKLAREARRKIN